MKKTIIAAAVAALVAAPAAFAEVSISGQINQEFTFDNDDTTNATRNGGALFGATDSNAGEDGLEQDTNVDVVLKSSEDLGNGTKVTATIHLLKDHGSDANVTANETIALSGDFGTVVVGRMEDHTEAKISGAADTWDPMDGFSLELQATASARTNGGAAYVSPSMNGFQVGIAGFAVESATIAAADWAGANDAQVDASDNFDATEIMLSYANGPLAVTYTREDFKDINISGAAADAVALAAANAATGGEQSDNLRVDYKMGDMAFVMTYQDRENTNMVANADVDGYFVGAKYTMGANEFSLGYAEHDYNAQATGNAAGGETSEDSGYIVGLKHNMSKNTGIYAAYQSQTIDFSGATADQDDDRFGVGIQHKF
jgi:hypothetical protein